MSALSSLIADDVVWHTPGRNVLSGERAGRDELLAHLGRLAGLTDGTYRTELLDVLASDARAAAFYRATGQRGGRNLDVRVVLLCEIRTQRIAEAFATPLDQHAFDNFFADIP